MPEIAIEFHEYEQYRVGYDYYQNRVKEAVKLAGHAGWKTLKEEDIEMAEESI